MQKSKNILSYCCLTILIFFHFTLNAQIKVTYNSDRKPLNDQLGAIAEKYQVRFAFDDDLLSKITTEIHYSEVPLTDFLSDICTKFGLKYKYIGGTYVFFTNDEIKLNKAIEATINYTPPDTLMVVSAPRKVKTTFNLSGIVVSKRSREKINHCRVILQEDLNTITNEMGFFSKKLVDTTEVRIRIRHFGYQRYDSIHSLKNDKALKIQLIPDRAMIRLSGKHVNNVNKLVDMSNVPDLIAFYPRSATEIPGTEASDLKNALTTLPGINYLKGTETGLSIRGGSPSDNLVLIDGIPMIESSHLMGNLSVLNAKYIQQAFISRGGFGAEYGGRTAGIVNLTGKTGSSDKTIVDFTSNLLHANIYIGVPINDTVSLAGSFKKSMVDVWPDLLINSFALENKEILTGNETESSIIDNTQINYSDLNVKLTITPNENREYTLNLFDSFDTQKRKYNFGQASDFYQDNYTNSRITGYSFNIKNQSNHGWLNTFSFGYNNMNKESSDEYGKNQTQKDLIIKSFFDNGNIDLREIRGNWKSELNLNKLTQKFGLGYNYNMLSFKYEDQEEWIQGASYFSDSISNYSVGSRPNVFIVNGYYQFSYNLTNRIKLRSGVRSVYDTETQDIYIQPRYGIEIQPLKHVWLNYYGGRYIQHQYLTYRVDSYGNISSIWYMPDQSKGVLNAFHHILGLKIEKNNILLNIEAFNKKNNGKVLFWGNKEIIDNRKSVNYDLHQGFELNKGIDLLLQYNTNHFKHMVSYSLSEATEQYATLNAGKPFYSFDHQLNRLRFTEVLNINGWTFSANWYWSNGIPYLNNESNSSNIIVSYFNNFTQLDASIVKHFRFQEFWFDIGVTTLNVLNNKNNIRLINAVIPEGDIVHQPQITTSSTLFSPLFYINFRYD